MNAARATPQYPPKLMLGLLIYSYATGTFSSRQIERATHESVAVRLLCADRHPDHDSICTFRRTTGALLQSGFHRGTKLAFSLVEHAGLDLEFPGQMSCGAPGFHERYRLAFKLFIEGSPRFWSVLGLLGLLHFVVYLSAPFPSVH